MADVRKELERLCKYHNDSLDEGDFEKGASIFTETATLMPNLADEVVGRQAIKDILVKIYPKYKSLVFEKFEYFELVGDEYAYTLDQTKSVGEDGKTKELFHGSRMWKKVDGKWLVDRQLFNNRPMPKTPEACIREHIEGKIVYMCASLDKQDYEAASSMYTEDGTMVPHGGDTVTGKEAIKAEMNRVVNDLTHLSVEETNYFKLLNDNTAYTNSRIKAVDDNGKILARFRNCLLWTTIDGEWYIKQDVFNDRPSLDA